MASKRTWSSSTYHAFIVWPHYLAKQTLLLISVLRVLFYWLNISFDSIKMMCGCLSQVTMLDVSAAILDNSFKTSTPFTDIAYCYQWNAESLCHSVTIARSVLPPSWIVVGADSLLKSTPNSVIRGINIKAIWPRVRFNEVDVLFSDSPLLYGRCALALHPAAVSTCNDDILLWYQAADPSRGQYCSSMSC